MPCDGARSLRAGPTAKFACPQHFDAQRAAYAAAQRSETTVPMSLQGLRAWPPRPPDLLRHTADEDCSRGLPALPTSSLHLLGGSEGQVGAAAPGA
jgi:hypothetical protein